METTVAFALGMSFVVVIVLSIVAVIGFVKAIKTEKRLNKYMSDSLVEYNQMKKDFRVDLDAYERCLHERINHVELDISLKEKHLNDRSDEIMSQMDSRLDKLKNVLTDCKTDVDMIRIQNNEKNKK
jgi:hypothetical protein